MYQRSISVKGHDASEGISDSTLTADLIMQTVSSCVQYEHSKQSRWRKYIAVGVFIWRSRNRSHLRRAKAPFYKRFLNKVARLDVRQKASDLGSFFKDRTAYIPLLGAPTNPTTPPDAAAPNHVIDIRQEQLVKEVATIVREKDLNALRARGGVDGVSELLRSHREEHADDGGPVPQVACKAAEPVFSHFFLKACNQYTILFLFGSAGLQFAIDFMKQDVNQGWHGGVAILATVFLLVAFPSVGNYRCERKRMEQLMERNRFLVDVERNGQSKIMICHVRVGDIVHLKKGDHAPADGLFMDHGVELVMDEVLSPTVDSEYNPFVLTGSKVIEGLGRMIVTSVGVDTASAEMLRLVTEDHGINRKTLLQGLLDKPYTYIEYLACCVSILIPLVVLIRLVGFKKHDNYNDRPELKGEVSINMLMRIFEKIFLKTQGTISTLVNVLAAAVIGIQHGMPFVISLALCQWQEKAVPNRVDPRNPSACVTMGLITVICIETTSEKSCNQMEVMDFWIGEKDLSNEVESDQTEQFALKGLHQQLLVTSANESFISSINTRWGTNTTDLRLLLDQTFTILEERNVYSSQNYDGTLVRKTEGGTEDMQQHMNGDASKILDMCSHYNDKTGTSPIMEIQRREFKQRIKKMEEKGFRTIAYAYKKTNVEEFTEHGMILLALVGVRCPYQEELKNAVEAFRESGIKIKLVSEDELSTVVAQASDLGIVDRSGEQIAGEAFRRLNSMERLNKVNLISVMGSSLPKDKLLMVERLKKNGHIVAFYGGLTVNDTATLKEADVGITQNIWSTEMARDNADIVVKDRCLWRPNLLDAKCAYLNIRNFCQVQLAANIAGLLVTLVATSLSGNSPLTAIHLIWVNLIMNLLGGLMMVMRLKGKQQLSQEPARTQPLITNAIWRTVTIQVSYQATVLLVLHFMGSVIPIMNQRVEDTMFFNIYTLCQVLNLLRAMDLQKKEVLNVVLRSYWFLMALGAVMIMQVVIVEFGKGLVSGVRLDATQWASCFILAALPWGISCTMTLKLACFRRENLPLWRSPLGASNRGRFYFWASLFLIFSVAYCLDSDDL